MLVQSVGSQRFKGTAGSEIRLFVSALGNTVIYDATFQVRRPTGDESDVSRISRLRIRAESRYSPAEYCRSVRFCGDSV